MKPHCNKKWTKHWLLDMCGNPCALIFRSDKGLTLLPAARLTSSIFKVSSWNSKCIRKVLSLNVWLFLKPNPSFSWPTSGFKQNECRGLFYKFMADKCVEWNLWYNSIFIIPDVFFPMQCHAENIVTRFHNSLDITT